MILLTSTCGKCAPFTIDRLNFRYCITPAYPLYTNCTRIKHQSQKDKHQLSENATNSWKWRVSSASPPISYRTCTTIKHSVTRSHISTCADHSSSAFIIACIISHIFITITSFTVTTIHTSFIHERSVCHSLMKMVAVCYRNVGQTIPIWLVRAKYLTCQRYLATQTFSIWLS